MDQIFAQQAQNQAQNPPQNQNQAQNQPQNQAAPAPMLQNQATPAPIPQAPMPRPPMNAPTGQPPYTSTASFALENQNAQQAATDTVNQNDALIAQLQQQNQALMEQNNALISQVSSFINQGVQLNQQPQQPPESTPKMTPPQIQQMMQMGMQPDPLGQINTPSLSNMQDFSLEGLASEIGKE